MINPTIGPIKIDFAYLNTVITMGIRMASGLEPIKMSGVHMLYLPVEIQLTPNSFLKRKE